MSPPGQAAPPAPNTRVLIVDDDAEMRALLNEELADEGYLVEEADGGRAAVARIRRGGIDVVVSDVRMPDMDGLDMLREIHATGHRLPVITITAFGSIDTAIRAVKLGAFDYITKPFEMRELLVTLEKALAGRDQGPATLEDITATHAAPRTEHLEEMVGRSKPLRDVFELVRRLEQASVCVLITGEAGTGKGLVARTLHARSIRAQRPFVIQRCAPVAGQPPVEESLFGFGQTPGALARAHTGTVFLDDVGHLSPHAQTRLLDFLHPEVPPGHSPGPRPDVRVIASLSAPIESLFTAGSFREDLYYRLNVVELNLPPLRERVEDILPLAEHFLARRAARQENVPRGLDQDARNLLTQYSFPGNVRELQNIVERAIALARSSMITPADLPAALRDQRNHDRLASAVAHGLTLGELEREYIEKVMQAEGGNKTRAALRLGMDRKTLYRKLDEYASSTNAPSANGPSKGQIP